MGIVTGTCLNCGNEFNVHLCEIKRGRKYCSSSCRSIYSQRNGGFNNKGGIISHDEGYLMIWKPDHPSATSGYVMQHRLIIEEKLGRILARSELVHHINGNKKDNRIENLQLITPSKHSTLHSSIFVEFNGIKMSFSEACSNLSVNRKVAKDYRIRYKLTHQQTIDHYITNGKYYHRNTKQLYCKQEDRIYRSVVVFCKEHPIYQSSLVYALLAGTYEPQQGKYYQLAKNIVYHNPAT